RWVRRTLAAVLAGTLALPSCRARSRAGEPHDPTYNRDVAPLLWERCAPCHRPGQLAPFGLLDYAGARDHAAQIVKAIRDRAMPPWLPEGERGVFANDRRLSQQQIDIIERWVASGTPEGSAADRRSPPAFVEGWHLGQPELVVELPDAYTLRPGRN